MMAPYASASVVSGACEIHLLGVSHNSALYGKLAQQLIEDVKPDVVVLEADEVRTARQLHRTFGLQRSHHRAAAARSFCSAALHTRTLAQPTGA